MAFQANAFQNNSTGAVKGFQVIVSGPVRRAMDYYRRGRRR